MSSERRTTMAAEKDAPVASEGKAKGRKTAPKAIVLPQMLTVKRLSELTHISPIDIIKQLMRNGIMASINQVVDYQLATVVTSALGIRTKMEQEVGSGTGSFRDAAGDTDPSKLVVRPPVVTILGHVDHGKTTLLDTIRKSHVADREVGSITQHIGAYQVNYSGKDITFLDTPGHEAFTAIRARGARVTDIAVLVVAADDGVMPQTVEALNHARAAGVSVVVAINKIDKPAADLEKVKRQLGENGLVLEEWGGDIITVPLSATTGDGIDNLLENLLVVAEVAELKADPDRPGRGVVVEAKLDRNRGPLATVLVQTGTVKVSDHVVAGAAVGRVKAMNNDLGKRTKEATPSVPVEIMGFGTLPEAGDTFQVVSSEKSAREIAEIRLRDRETEQAGARAMTLEEIYSRIHTGEIKELNLVIKADVQGSVEAVVSSLEHIDEEKARVRILHANSGSITESDVLLAGASKAIVIGFSTSSQLGIEQLAEREGVEIRNYNVIYHLIEDIEKALKGILEVAYRDVVVGHAEIRAIFSVGKKAKIAGCMVTDGRISKGALLRVQRNGELVHEGNVSSLRHFKEEVNEMGAGFECGIGLAGYMDFEEGDVLETYRREKARA